MRRVTVGGYQIAVQDIGNGQQGTAVLLHGFPDYHVLWSAQAAALAAAGWRVVVPDLLGCGASDRPQEVAPYALRTQAALVVELMDRLGCQRFCVAGHDYGAALAWWLAMLAPHRVQKLVVISVGSPACFFAAGGMEQRRRAWYQLFFLHHPAAEEGLAADSWALFRQLVCRDEPSQQVQQQYIAALSQPGALTAALNWYRANTPPAAFASTRPHEVPLVRCPTLGIWSSGDGALTEAQMTASRHHVAPDMWRYERIEGCGHWVPRGAAERLNELLLEFLGGGEGGLPGQHQALAGPVPKL